MATQQFVLRYWNGQGPLWRVYWLYGVLGSFLLLGVFLLPLQARDLTLGYYLLTAAVMIAYTAWILVSVWRCAFNVRDTRWAYLARALTVFWALNVLLVGVFLGLDLLA